MMLLGFPAFDGSACHERMRTEETAADRQRPFYLDGEIKKSSVIVYRRFFVSCAPVFLSLRKSLRGGAVLNRSYGWGMSNQASAQVPASVG